MKVGTIGGKILAATIVVYLLWTGTATGETNTYKFDPDRSTVIRSFLTSDTYTLTGAFQLTVHANTGSFDWVDATFSDDPNLQTGDLGELFYMDELVGDVVNDTTIRFEFPPGHPMLQSYDIDITLTFENDHVRLTGHRNPLMVGEPGYTLDAVANLVNIVYVDANAPGGGDGSSWTTAYNFLQDALADANSSVKPVEIWVAEGTYKPDRGIGITRNDREATFQLINDVTVKGGYAGLGDPDPDARDISLYESILSGDLNGDDGTGPHWDRLENSYHVVTGYQTETVNETTEVLDGFTIIGGNANGSNADAYGGGMYYNCYAAVVNCTFTDNFAIYGGGMYCGPSGCCTTDTTLTNCAFIDNSASEEGGAMWVGDNNPIMTNCRIIGNSAGRRGGGIMFGNDNRTTMLNCLINGNSAGEDGGGIYGIFCFGWTGTNCTFSNNSADNLGGGIFKGYDTDMILTNCIFWGNSDSGGGDESAQIHVDEDEFPLINYTCIQGWTGSLGGIGNIGDDPLFIDADGTDDVAGTEDDDLRLQRHSPCIDAGDNSAVPSSLLVDLDHKLRIANHIVDIGAYEKQSFSLSSNFLVVPEGGTATFTVALLDDPLKTIEVTIVRHSGDGDITVESGHNLSFDSSNYAKPQIVVLAAAEDEDYLNGTAEIWISGPDLLAAVVIAAEGENEPVPKILYVDSRATGANDGWSWNDAFTRLQDALGIAAEYPQVKEIRVAGGSYTPAEPFSGDREATFRIVNGLTMLGSYAGLGAPNPDARDFDTYTTVLSGDLNGNDGPDFAGYEENSYHVVTANWTDPTTVLDGFEIRSGNAGFRHGGGINSHYNGSYTVSNCAFIENMADGGAAITGGNPTIIDCTFIGNTSNGNGGAIGFPTITDTGSTITGCTFIGNTAGGDGGGAIHGDALTVVDCTFMGNTAVPTYGITRDGGAIKCGYSTLVNCVFSGNLAARGGAVFASGGTVVGCTFIENSGQKGALYGSSVTLVNSIFWNNNPEGGPQIGFNRSGLTSSVSFCDVQGGRQSIYVKDQPPEFQWGPGNIDADPCFVDPDGGDNMIGTEDDNLRLLPDSPCIDAGDNTAVPPSVLTDLDGNPRVMNGTVDMGAYEFQGIQILYVDDDAAQFGNGTSWATAFKYLQDALFKAVPPAEIRVAQGIYKPHLNTYSAVPPSRTDTFQLKSGVTIKGGYAGLGQPNPNARDISLYETILSGDINGDDEPNFVDNEDNSYHVVTGSGCDETAVIDGFTSTSGNANGGFNWDDPRLRGGGIYTTNGSPTIANCAFVANRAKYGAGMYNEYGSATIYNCVFANNKAGHSGGGIRNHHSSPTLVNCSITANVVNESGGGINNYESSPILVNCAIVGNYGHFYAGGIKNNHSDLTLANCTVAANTTTGNGAGLWNSGEGYTTVDNCIFWNNVPQEIDNGIGILIVAYSCVRGSWPGVGNIDADPCFVEPGYWDANGTPADANDDFWVDGDYHLSLDSPCIDTGDPGYVAGPNETDLDGNPRVIGGRIDMGAYEFFGPVYVDDDGPNDPGPGDPQVGDPLENGTEYHPFDTIQEAVNVALEGYTVLVRQGSYSEPGTSNCIDFLGKNITLTSADPTDWDIVDRTVIRGYVQFTSNEGPDCKFTGFRISSLEGAIYGNHTHATISHCNISGNGPCGATVIKDCDGIISNCLITDNTTFFQCGVFPVVFGCNGVIKNCTIANNISGVSVGSATIKNCIIYNNSGSQLGVGDSDTLNISYCNLQGGLEGITGGGIVNWGPGNIDTDPCFVRLGYWIMDEVTLVAGDYHLRSEGWRWNTEGKSWTYDYITSRCIDAGNPASDLGDELMSVPRDPDNIWGVNLRINMGAYGGTGQAGMPPYDWALMPDLNNDGIVNFVDFAYQAQDWLTTAPEQPGDQNRDGLVNKMDLALLAEEWLRVTFWCEY